MKPHPHYENLFVTAEGEVWYRLPQTSDSGGYLMVTVPNATGRRSRERVHVLVTEAFKGPRPRRAHARHLNGDNRDNRAENLDWGSAAENHQDARGHGTATIGERNTRAKLTLAQAQEIYDRRKSGESLRTLAGEFGISTTQIVGIAAGREWPQVNREK